MCLQISRNDPTSVPFKIHIYKRNILVYKRLTEGIKWGGNNRQKYYTSPYMHSKYELGKVKSARYFTECDGDLETRFRTKVPKFEKRWLFEINEGLHAYASKVAITKGSRLYQGSCTVVCVIPAGTPFIKYGDEVVALKLIPKKVV